MSPHLAIGLLAVAVHVLAQTEAQTDPATEPATEPRNFLGYTPSIPLAVVSGVLYFALPVACLIWSLKRWARFMLTILIGGVFYSIGLFLRIALINSPGSLGLYIVMNMFTVLSPCGFIATVYMLLGRLAVQLDAEDFLLIKPRLVTKLFVTSDVVTLLIQASGGSMSSMKSLNKIGTKIFLIGLIVQLISFAIYMVIFAIFLYRMKVNRPSECRMGFSERGSFAHWTTLASAISISCIGILIRSVFRTVENAQGFHGYLATHEVYFYVLDTLPLFVATFVFIVVWPPMYVSGYKSMAATSTDTAFEMGASEPK